MLALALALTLSSPVVVGVEDAAPFAYQLPSNEWTGISVDLWKAVAKDNGWETMYVVVPFEDYEESLGKGYIDVYLPAVTITAERESRMDFSMAYYRDNLAVASKTDSSYGAYVLSFFNAASYAILPMTLALLLSGLCYLIVEKRQWSWRNYFDSIYWAITTAATVGYGDESPRTIPGRVLSMAWMIMGIMFFSYCITSLQNIKPNMELKDYDNLAAQVGTTGHAIASRYEPFPVDTEKKLLQAYEQGYQIVNDESLLRHQLPHAVIQPLQFSQWYGFVFGEDSLLLEDTNQGILRVLESPTWAAIKELHQ